MKSNELSDHQAQAAQKAFAWMACSKPSISARSSQPEEDDGVAEGIAVPLHKHGRGRSHPMRGTNSEDLTEWCIEHQT